MTEIKPSDKLVYSSGFYAKFLLCLAKKHAGIKSHIKLYMAYTDTQQIKKLIEDKKHILITFRQDGKGDAIASAAALVLFLNKIGKRVDVACANFSLPKNLTFLKEAKEIKPEIGHLQKFIILVDITKTGIQELSYDVKNDNLRIFVTPKSGSITKEDIRTAQSDFKYDLVFTLDTSDLMSLGGIYANNSDFWYQTTIINIDHQPSNEHFGHINIVDLTMSTTAEILFNLCKEIKPEYVNADIATAFLTGIIAGTNSFKKNNVRPQTLATASELVNLGADRDYIIKNLYQTKSISTFKLWGAALSNLQYAPEINLVWSTITREDFIRSGADETDLPAIIDELISNSPAAKLILLLHEHQSPSANHQIHGIFQTTSRYNAKELLSPFNAQGDQTYAMFVITGEKSLKQMEEEIIKHLKNVVK